MVTMEAVGWTVAELALKELDEQAVDARSAAGTMAERRMAGVNFAKAGKYPVSLRCIDRHWAAPAKAITGTKKNNAAKPRND